MSWLNLKYHSKKMCLSSSNNRLATSLLTMICIFFYFIIIFESVSFFYTEVGKKRTRTSFTIFTKTIEQTLISFEGINGCLFWHLRLEFHECGSFLVRYEMVYRATLERKNRKIDNIY